MQQQQNNNWKKKLLSIIRTGVAFRDAREIAKSKICYRAKILTIILIHFITFWSSLRIFF